MFAEPDGKRRVLIAGTYNAHPFTTAGAIATLKRLIADDGAVYRHLEALSARLQEGLEGLFREKGLAATISRNASAYCAYFMDHVPVDWHDLLASNDFDFDRRYPRALIKGGVYHFPLPCKQGSISAAHTESDIDRTLEVTRDVLKAL